MVTNCHSCGAPIDYSRKSCDYCGTPYRPTESEPITVHIDTEYLSTMLARGAITRNEARRRLGLPPT